MANLMLEEITNQYSRFVSDQVLTADQLNELIDFFEDQNRLTRICLSGVGIVCGLSVSCDLTNDTITVSKGVGITTDGDLLKFEGSTFSHFKIFKDKNASYSKFTNLTLYELTTSGGDNLLETLSGWQNRVAVLYLEHYSSIPTVCSSQDCNNLGQKQLLNLKVLLISAEDAQLISQYNSDPVFAKHNNNQYFTGLPDIDIQRVILQNKYITNSEGEVVIGGKSNTTDYETLVKSYFSVFVDTDVINNLKLAFKSLLNDYENLLETDSIGINQTKLDAFFDHNFNASDNLIPFDFQYRYDLLKDLVDTYKEIKDLLFELSFVCSPGVNSFPKHLLLGELTKTEKYYQYRHTFYPSHILTNGYDTWRQIRSLIRKFYLLLEEYSIPNPKEADIKITPSVNYDRRLSVRSIPYYFKTSGTMVPFWDYVKTKMFEGAKNFGYRTDNLYPSDRFKNPLKYNIDKNDFFRIEGHIGKNYQDALEEIIRLKTAYSLPFDVKILSIGLPDVEINPEDYKCEFDGLRVTLDILKTEQENTLAGVSEYFSGFSTLEVGFNVKETSKLITPVVRGNSYSVEATGLKTDVKTLADVTPVNASVAKVVPENLTTDEGTLGNIIVAAFEEYKDGSVNDIIARANELIASNLSDEVWNDQAMKELLIDKSVEVLAYAHVLDRVSPGSLADLQSDMMTDYNAGIEKLCSLVKQLKTAYLNEKLSEQVRSQSSLLINHLSNICNLGEEVKVLQDEIEERKNTILLNMQLSKFVEANTGLEHKAGCGPGETFFMVYLADSLSLSTSENTEEVEVVESFENRSSRITKEASNVIDLEKTTDNELLLKVGDIARFYLNKTDIPAETVIADFTLPYICCSKCLNVNYIFPVEPTFLKLEKNRICLGNETETISFEASPVGAKVEPADSVPGLKIEGGNIFILPGEFSDDWIDKPIGFKINGTIADCTLTTHKKPISEFDVSQEGNKLIILNNSTNATSYIWEIDGVVNENIASPRHEIGITPDSPASITVKLTAKNEYCEDVSDAQTVELKYIDIKISLSKTEFCETDEKEYLFEIDSSGMEAVIDGDGVVLNDQNEPCFNPSKVADEYKYPQSCKFFVNGELSDFYVFVYRKVIAKLSFVRNVNQLFFSNLSDEALGYRWVLDKNESVESDHDFVFVVDLNPEQDTYVVRLTAINGPCEHTQELSINEPYDPKPDCYKKITEAIVSDNNKFVSKEVIEKIENKTLGNIYTESIKAYKKVIELPEEYLSGERNSEIPDFWNLIKTTYSQVLDVLWSDETELKEQMVAILKLQILLFFNIQKCQYTDWSEKEIDFFKEVIDGLVEFTMNLLEARVKIDEDGEIKAFLLKVQEYYEGQDDLYKKLNDLISYL